MQNYKKYAIRPAQLIIADVPYNVGNNFYGSNPMWYNGGDNKNGESKLAGKAAFNSDFNFNLYEYFHFCSKMLKKDDTKPVPRGRSIMVVKTDKGCFISDCFATSGYDYNYHKSVIERLLFNGKPPAATYYPNWYYIEEYPTLIQIEKNGDVVNRRYELNDKSLISDKMPEIITYEEKDNYNYDVIENLYSYEYDRTPNYLEEYPCEIQVVCEIDNYNFPPQIEYTGIHKWDYSDTPYTIKNADVQHQMLDKMIFPAVLLHESPCKFTSKQMYDITRQYILEHIDNSVAKITSNYDFCFTVRKLIPLIEPETISYQNIFARTKRERNKIHTSIKKYEEKDIFEMTYSPENYKGYSPIPEMCANSESELREKVDKWLDGLIEIINKPLCQCPECNGTGYVGDIEKGKFDYTEN